MGSFYWSSSAIDFENQGHSYKNLVDFAQPWETISIYLQ